MKIRNLKNLKKIVYLSDVMYRCLLIKYNVKNKNQRIYTKESHCKSLQGCIPFYLKEGPWERSEVAGKAYIIEKEDGVYIDCFGFLNFPDLFDFTIKDLAQKKVFVASSGFGHLIEEGYVKDFELNACFLTSTVAWTLKK